MAEWETFDVICDNGQATWEKIQSYKRFYVYSLCYTQYSALQNDSQAHFMS